MRKKARRQLVPVIGVWYHLKNKSLHGGDHRIYYLCTQINEQNPNEVMLYYSKNEITQSVWVSCDKLRVAYWLGTNRFHQFCLWKLTDILKNRPTPKELFDDEAFQLYFGFCTRYRVHRAANEQFAIDRTYNVISKTLNDDQISQEKKEQLVKNHKLLIDEFYQSIEHHFIAS